MIGRFQGKNTDDSELSKSSKRFKADRARSDFTEIIDSLQIGVVVTDAAGNPVEHNQTADRIFGVIPDVLAADNWPERLGLFLDNGKTHIPAKETPLWQALIGSRDTNEAELFVQTAGSSGSWMSMSATTMWNNVGKVRGAIVSFADINQRSQWPYDKTDSILQSQAISAFSHQIAMSADDPTRILNNTVEFTSRLIGDGSVASLISISGNKLRLISSRHKRTVPGKLLQAVTLLPEYGFGNMTKKVIQSGEPLRVEVVDEALLLKNSPPEFARYVEEVGIQSLLVVPIKSHDIVLGTLALFRDRGMPAFDQSDQLLVMDIAYMAGLMLENNTLVNSLRVENSWRLSAEKALEFSEVRFRSIFTSTPLGIKILDLKGNFLVSNPAFQKMLGYSADELLGKPLTDFLYQPDAPEVILTLDKLNNFSAQSVQIEHRLIARDGSILWVNATFSRIEEQDDNSSFVYIVGISENVTERKKIEAEMVKMKSRLNNHIEAERLHLTQELHDGPLQDIYSALYRIENWGEPGSKVDQANVEILKQDLLKVVQGLRETAKDLRPPTLTNFGLEKAIRSHVKELMEVHPELQVHLKLAQDKQELPEETRIILFRIYQNSLANVLRHAHASELYITFLFDAESARLEIRDNGVGFMLPNHWVDLVRQGHYGLAGAVERAELMGGTFKVESKPGEGTLVVAWLPIVDATKAPEEEELEK